MKLQEEEKHTMTEMVTVKDNKLGWTDVILSNNKIFSIKSEEFAFRNIQAATGLRLNITFDKDRNVMDIKRVTAKEAATATNTEKTAQTETTTQETTTQETKTQETYKILGRGTKAYKISDGEKESFLDLSAIDKFLSGVNKGDIIIIHKEDGKITNVEFLSKAENILTVTAARETDTKRQGTSSNFSTKREDENIGAADINKNQITTNTKTDHLYRTGSTYPLRGKQIADSALTQSDANAAKISTETIDLRIIDLPGRFSIFGNRRVIARARSIDKLGYYNEGSCELTLLDEINLRFLEIVKKVRMGKQDTETQRIIRKLLSAGKTLSEIFEDKEFIFVFTLNEAANIASFITRTAETKAQKRAQQKTLNQEFREREEIVSEDEEIIRRNDYN